MRRLSIFTLVLFLVYGTAAPARAVHWAEGGLSSSKLGLGTGHEDQPFEPGWEATAGAVILHRSRPRGLPIASQAVPPGDVLLRASQFGLGFAAGPLVGMTKHVHQTTAVEILYFTIDDWSARRAVEPAGGVVVPRIEFSSPAVFDRLEATYASKLTSTEINAKRPLAGNFHWLVGFRWLELNESFDSLLDGRIEGTDYATLAVHASNQLVGFQLGLDGPLWRPGERLRVDGLLKAGVFGNKIVAGADLGGTLSGTPPGAPGDGIRTSFVGELGLLGTVELSQHFAVSGGYQVMWINGVWLATDIFDANAPSASDAAFYHGARITLEAKW